MNSTGRAEIGHVLAQAIVDTISEPLLVLDAGLRVVAASRSFYTTFNMARSHVHGRLIYKLGTGQWNVPQLRLLLEKILPQRTVMEGYEIECDFAGKGKRTMLLNARAVFSERDADKMILLAMADVTGWRTAERELKDLLDAREILLRDIHHRVANSLQIIASALLLKARKVWSEETRLQLYDAHQRVMSVAALEQTLQASGGSEVVEVGPYLSRLCEAIAASLMRDARPIALNLALGSGVATTSEAVSIGLIVTELVVNALKHAFRDRTDGQIVVAYEAAATGWTLAVSDNGVGVGAAGESKPGLGTGIIEALARQLDASVQVSSGPQGTKAVITRSVSTSQIPDAA
jgi:two-component sensor histidine kinase